MASDKKLDLDPKYDDYDFPTLSPNTQNGHPGHTTPMQDAQVFQLRTMLEQAGYTERLDTLTLLRFLRARKFDVEKSKAMFIDCEKWRESFNVDDLAKNFEYTEKEKIFQYYPQYYHKTDKDGRPVYIEHFGKIDLKKIQEITTNERMIQNLVAEYERMADPRLPACSRKSGYLLETCTTIMDAKGVSLGMAPSVYGYLQLTSGVSQNYYPERLGKMYIINAPWGFSTVFSMIKSFLDPVTVAKIHILGSGYQKELMAQIPKENLPKTLGGDCDCPGGCMFSDLGPWKDQEWARPPKWARAEGSGATETEQTVEPVQDSSGVAEGTPAGTETLEAGKPAAAGDAATAPAAA